MGSREQTGYHGGGNDIPDRRDMRQEQKAQPCGKGENVGQPKQLIGAHDGLRSFEA